MSKGPKWSEFEVSFLRGILNNHGAQPRAWSQEVRDLVKARLAERTESGIYQQALKIIKGRHVAPDNSANDNPYMIARGA